MTTLPDAIPAQTTITIGGTTYPLAAPTLNDWSAICQRLREQVPNPIPALIPQLVGLPESLALKLYTETLQRYEAKTNVALDQAVSHAFSSSAGLGYLLWLLLSRSAPGRFSESDLFAYAVDLQAGDPIGVADLIERLTASAGLRAVGEFLARAIRDAAARAEKTGAASSGISASRPNLAAAASIPPASVD